MNSNLPDVVVLQVQTNNKVYFTHQKNNNKVYFVK